eukprot:7578523-Ditylum_brightwellii.AAC.1
MAEHKVTSKDFDMQIDKDRKNGLEGFDEVPNPLKTVMVNPDPMDLTEMGSQASKHANNKFRKLGRRSEGKKCLKNGTPTMVKVADKKRVTLSMDDKEVRKEMWDQLKKAMHTFAKGKGS